ncbi:MAG: methyltransferase domain-containing protein [Hyphomicrobiales bacterium]|nr:methyltransferase domain-containing protein [Hyphomicrobiales bacterium]
MSDVEEGVSRHYSAYDVLPRIRAGLQAMGRDPDHVEPGDLRLVDEFHIGGAEATAALLSDLDIRAGMDVLDIGCGIGGPARAIALETKANVTGVDLTPDFVEAASALSSMAGMDDRVVFTVGSALNLPFADATFDFATLLHVGMNIADKPQLFREAHRVLRPAGVFALYEVMRTGDGILSFPVPWAEREELSALAAPEAYRDAAAQAGFRLEGETDRRSLALDFFDRIRAQAGGAKPSPLGLHLLMGPTVGQKTANMVDAIKAGTIAPVQMIFRKA